MIHLTDDMLLAYVRRQQRNLWTAQMQEHLELCPVCRGRCAEFKKTGDVLEAWARSPVVDPLYVTVSNRVMRTLYEPKAAPIERIRSGSGISRVRIVLPIAVVVVLLFAVLLVGLQTYRAGNVAAKPNKVPATPQIIVQQPTAIPSEPTPTPSPIEPTVTSVPLGPTATAPVVSGGGGPTATSTPQSTPVIEVNSPCTTVIDETENQFHVCGTHFTPGTTVTIYYHISAGSLKHTAQVGVDGTFNDMLYIQSCNDVPGSIYVRSSSNPPQTAEIAKNITFGTCQGFGGLRKTKK